MKTILLIGLLIAVVSANPIERLEKNLTQLWGIVNEMKEHHGVHIHLDTTGHDGGHHHDSAHMTTDGGNDAHVYLHMELHDEHNDLHEHHDSHEFDDILHDDKHGHNGDHHHEHDHDDHDDSDEVHDMKMDKVNKTHDHYFYYHHGHHMHESLEAHCDLVSNSDAPFKGHIHLKQVSHDLMSVHVDFDCPANIAPGTKLGLHVHEGTDLSGGCNALGGHFNPHGVHHGGRNDGYKHRHIGDWGNVVCDSSNEVEHEFYERISHLSGAHSILNRSIVLHMGTDDYGKGGAPDSKKTGAAGGRMACCIIKKKMGDDHH